IAVGVSHPHLAGLPAGRLVMAEMDADAIAASADLVFSALPNGTRAGLAPAILDAGAPVTHRAGHFRPPSASYPAWSAFAPPAHQHTPEIERGIELASGGTVQALFVPHLVPAVRGVVTTSYLTATSGVSTAQLTECLAAAYDGEPFVRVLPPGGMVDAKRARG